MSKLALQKTMSQLDNYINRKETANIIRWIEINGAKTASLNMRTKIKTMLPKIYVEHFKDLSIEAPVQLVRTFDEVVATKYLNKLKNAQDRNLEFNLTLTSIRNIMKAKQCYFTKIPLDSETITIDRVNSKLGYIKGNVVACHTDVNAFKALIESNTKGLGLKEVTRMIKLWEKRL